MIYKHLFLYSFPIAVHNRKVMVITLLYVGNILKGLSTKIRKAALVAKYILCNNLSSRSFDWMDNPQETKVHLNE